MDDPVENRLAHRRLGDQALRGQGEAVGRLRRVGVEHGQGALDDVDLLEEGHRGVGHDPVGDGSARNIEDREVDERRPRRCEGQASRLREVVVGAQRRDPAQDVRVRLGVVGPEIGPHQGHGPRGHGAGGEGGAIRHGVVVLGPLAVEPPLGAVHRCAGVAHAPPQAARGVRHRFARLGHVQDEDALAPDVTGLDIGRYVDRPMNAPAEPVGAQLGSEDDAGLVLDAEDEGAAARRVRHAGHLVREFHGGRGVLLAAGLEVRAIAPSGLLLEVDGGGLGDPRDGAVALRGEDLVDVAAQLVPAVQAGWAHGLLPGSRRMLI